MKMNNGWIAAVVVVLTLVAGCKGSHNQNSTDMRALNAVVDAEPLDVLVDSNVIFSAVALGSTTAYSEFSQGGRDVQLRSSTNSTILVDKSLTFASGANATLVMYGKRAAIGTLLLTDDDPTSPASGNFAIRAVGLSPDAGAVDLYVVPSGNISALPPTISAITYTVATGYAEVTAGSYQLIFTAAGTKDILFQSTTLALSAGQILTAMAFPSLGGHLVNGVLLSAGSGAMGTFIPNPFGRLKGVNAIPDSTAGVNFKADGTALLSNVPFMGSSSYVTAATGTRTLQLEASNAPGTVIASRAQQIDPAKDYTVVAVNDLAQAQLVTFTDDNTVPATGFAKLRFANTMVGSTVVDVQLNFASQTTNLAYGSASPYYQIAPSLTYAITFSTAAGITVIATLPTVEIDAGAVYTAYLFGNATSPQARLVRDR
jgi:outer membrane murein-binding lipoprotein Lpp